MSPERESSAGGAPLIDPDSEMFLELKELQPLPPERHVSRYRLCYELATGGMATIFLARSEGPGRFEKLVALKCILPHLAKDKRFVEMFFDEARIAARIDHPNVCRVFDFGEHDGEHFIAMEYVVGETFSRLIRRSVELDRPIPPAIAARLVADACEGLHAAHELRDREGNLLEVVHRDVSPQNLFVAYDGSARVMDFGIARASDRTHETRSGVLKGKIAYMAPEQLRRGTVDRRADVWALGVVLWELLVRRRLFRRDSEVETIRAIDEGDIPAPKENTIGVPAALSDVVMKALDRDLSGRYATAREMGRDLRAYLAQCGNPVGPPEVADLMADLFSNERVEHMRLIEEARTVSESRATLALSAGGHPEPSESKIVEKAVAVRQPKVPTLALLLLLGVAGLGAIAGVVTVFALVSPQDMANEPVAERAAPPSAVEAPVQESAPVPPVVAGSDPRPVEVPSPEAVAVRAVPDEPVIEAPAPPEAPDPTPEEPEVARPPAPRAVLPRVRRPVPPVTRPAAVQTGQVFVVANGGWADIYVRGERVGRTPTRLTLPIGRHVLELRPNAQPPGVRRRVQVTQGQSARVSVEITGGRIR